MEITSTGINRIKTRGASRYFYDRPLSLRISKTMYDTTTINQLYYVLGGSRNNISKTNSVTELQSLRRTHLLEKKTNV